MTDLRKLAEGQDCQCRFLGVCNFDPATTVLAHINRGGVRQVPTRTIRARKRNTKSPDCIGVWACSDCHDEIDRLTRKYYGAELDSMILDALCRTLHELVRRDILKW